MCVCELFAVCCANDEDDTETRRNCERGQLSTNCLHAVA